MKNSFLSAAFDPQEIVQRSQSYEGFMPIFGTVKPAVEPITTPLKWVLADAVGKVSTIFLNIVPIQCREMQNYSKSLVLTQRCIFSRHQSKNPSTICVTLFLC